MAKKKSTLGKLGSAVADAASTVATATNDRVLRPVGKALGIIGKPKKKVAARSKSRTKPAAKKSTRKASMKRSTAKR